MGLHGARRAPVELLSLQRSPWNSDLDGCRGQQEPHRTFAALAGRTQTKAAAYLRPPPAHRGRHPAHDAAWASFIGATVTMLSKWSSSSGAQAHIARGGDAFRALDIYDDMEALTYESSQPRDVLAVACLREMGRTCPGPWRGREAPCRRRSGHLLDVLAENESYINGEGAGPPGRKKERRRSTWLPSCTV